MCMGMGDNFVTQRARDRGKTNHYCHLGKHVPIGEGFRVAGGSEIGAERKDPVSDMTDGESKGLRLSTRRVRVPTLVARWNIRIIGDDIIWWGNSNFCHVMSRNIADKSYRLCVMSITSQRGKTRKQGP